MEETSSKSMPNREDSSTTRTAFLNRVEEFLPSPLSSFLTATHETQANNSLRITLKWLLLARVGILSILLGTTTWSLLQQTAQEHSTRLVFYSIALTYFISALHAFWLTRSKKPILVGYSQLVTDVLLATLAIYVTSSAVSITLYLLCIVAAALVFSRHGAVIIAALSGLAYAVLMSGLLPSIPGGVSAPDPSEILGVYLSLIVIALISSFFAKQLEAMGVLADTRAKSLDELSQQQQQLFDRLSEGVITLDLDSVITGINEAARAIVGLSKLKPEEFLGKRIDVAFKQFGIKGVDKLLEDSEIHTPHELRLQSPNGSQEIQLSYSIKKIERATGEHTGKILFLNDISHVRNIEERLALHERMTKLLSETNDHPARTTRVSDTFPMIGESSVMKRVFTLLERVSESDASVLITGESGTGKELVARSIHNQSARSEKAFVAINCGAMPENLIESELFGHKKGSFTGAVTDSIGLFRQAHGGTVFLDEIGELPLHLQTKLLRVLQERVVRPVGETKDYPVDVRILAATNRELKKEIQAARFREDLYYRLNVVQVFVPPLRERKEDIPLLVRHFLTSGCGEFEPLPQISPDALHLLSIYAFPGNIRELENIVARARVLGGHAILPEHLPEEVLLGVQSTFPRAERRETDIIVLPIDLEKELEKLERAYLERALEDSGGIKKNAAELLGLNFRSFRYRLKKYGMASDSDL